MFPSSEIIIPEPVAVAVDFPKYEFTLYSISIPTMDGSTFSATLTAVSE